MKGESYQDDQHSNVAVKTFNFGFVERLRKFLV
jgi:hypothetical protein